MKDLEAENATLRAQVETLTRERDEARVALAEQDRFIVCIWCGEDCAQYKGPVPCPPEEVPGMVAKVEAHDRSCPKNPLRVALEKSESQLAAANKEREEWKHGDNSFGTWRARAEKAEFQLAAANKERDELRAVSEGRLKALNEKAEEAKREWVRAEKAEAESKRLREAADAVVVRYRHLQMRGAWSPSVEIEALEASLSRAPEQGKENK